MREIKARAWFPNAKRMIHFEDIGFCDEYDRMYLNIRESDCTDEYQHLAGKSFIPNENGVSSWFTGLKDKNDIEIYEGDIVKAGNLNKRVFMRLGCWFAEMGKELGYYGSENLEVIGNLYENEELLK